jgi:hypothetical protein
VIALVFAGKARQPDMDANAAGAALVQPFYVIEKRLFLGEGASLRCCRHVIEIKAAKFNFNENAPV